VGGPDAGAGRKSTKRLPNPRASLAKYVTHRSGYFFDLKPAGKRMIKYLRLNEEKRVETRHNYLALFDKQNVLPRNLLRWFEYPSDLPDLSKLKPPRNSRSKGIEKSHYARRDKKKLPLYY
jgi:hypothetical protein